ncbi:cation diffusion facilitator family transporter [Christensenellaceae bacterium OttesenSCG-928-K19]|nr:cation diffusion facilitator family transporter [Christensenellaceae bacterium OttesenSCG-928-K19]
MKEQNSMALKTEDRFQAAKKVAMLGIAINILLLAFKLVVGYSAGSQAMIADGFNSMGDVFASVVTLLGSAYAAKPSDEDHVWGHGKAEYIASMIIGFSMIAMAVYTALGAAGALAAQERLEFSGWLVAAAIITIAAKLILFVYCRRKGEKFDSLLIHANAQDHRNDIFVTAGTLAAILLSLAGVFWVDGAVGIVISVWIAYNGFRIVKDASNVLMDSNADKDVLEEYKNEILRVDGVDHIDSVVAKPVGAKYILIVKISVNRDLKVLQSHGIAKMVENELLQNRMEIEDVIVHINPDLPHEGRE